MELVVQFPARGSTQVLLYLFPGVLWPWHFLYSVGPHQESSCHIYTLVVSRAFMAGAASQAGYTDFSGHLVSLLVCSGPWMSTVVLNCWCHSNSTSVLLYFTLLLPWAQFFINIPCVLQIEGIDGTSMIFRSRFFCRLRFSAYTRITGSHWFHQLNPAVRRETGGLSRRTVCRMCADLYIHHFLDNT